MRRRAWGSIQVRSGSIRIGYRTPKGFTWESLPRGSTRKDAEALLAQRMVELERGSWIEPATTTIGQFLEYWLERRAAEGTVAGTLRHYRECIQRVLPLVGDIKMQALTRQDIERARDTLNGEGLAPKTVNNILNSGRAAWNWAIDQELVSKNPWSRVKRLRVPRYEARVLTREEATKFLRALREEGPPYGPMLAAALLTLKRVKSEWGPVRWRDVDLVARRVRIRAIKDRDGSIRPAGSLKTRDHTIPIPRALVPFLEQQRAWQRALFDQPSENVVRITATADEADRLVFTNHLGEHLPQTSLYYGMQRCLERAGISDHVRIHDLRHTGASLLLALGTPLKEIQELCAHSQLSTTADIYSHFLPGALTETVDRLGDALLQAQ